MDITELYPNRVEAINTLRAKGIPDSEIRRGTEAWASAKIEEGYSKEEVQAFLGITPEIITRLQEEQKNTLTSLERFSAQRGEDEDPNEWIKRMAKARTREAVSSLSGQKPGDIVYEHRGSGLWNPFNLMSPYEAELKDLERKIQDRDRPKTIAGIVDVTSDRYGLIDEPFSAEHNAAYAGATLAWSWVGKPALALASLPSELFGAVVDVVAPKSRLKAYYDEVRNVGRNPEEYFDLPAYLNALRHSRTEEARKTYGVAGSTATIATDAVADLMGTILSFTTMAGAVNGMGGASSYMNMQNSILGELGHVAIQRGVHAFATTSGTPKERLEAGVWRNLYSITPHIVAAAPTALALYGARAVIADVALNSVLSSPMYYQLYKEHGFSLEFAEKAVSNMVIDIGMAWGTRGDPTRMEAMKNSDFARIKANAFGISYEDALKDVENTNRTALEAKSKLIYNHVMAEETDGGWIPNNAVKGEAQKAMNLIYKEHDLRTANEIEPAGPKMPWEMTRSEYEEAGSTNKGNVLDRVEALVKEEVITKEEGAKATALINKSFEAVENAWDAARGGGEMTLAGEDAKTYYRLTSAISAMGRAGVGLDYESFARNFGIETAREIRGKLKQAFWGKPKKDTDTDRRQGIDTFLDTLREEHGIDFIRDEAHLIETLAKGAPKGLSRTQADKAAKGEGVVFDDREVNPHYMLIKTAIQKGEEVPANTLKEYPDLAQLARSLEKVPSKKQAFVNPSAITKALDGDLTFGDFFGQSAKKLGLTQKEKDKFKSVFQYVLTRLTASDTESVHRKFRDQLQQTLAKMQINKKAILTRKKELGVKEEFLEELASIEAKASFAAKKEGKDADTEALNARARFLSAIHPDDADRLMREDLNGMTIKDFVERATVIKDLYYEGRKQLELERAAERERVDRWQDDLVKELTDPKNHAFFGTIARALRQKKGTLSAEAYMADSIIKEQYPGGVKRTVMGTVAHTMRPDRILHMLQGGKEKGPWTDILWMVEKGTDASLTMMANRRGFINQELEKHGMTPKDLIKPGPSSLKMQDADGNQYTPTISSAMLIYAYSRNEGGRDRLQMGNGLKEDYIQRVEQALTPEQKDMAMVYSKEQENNFDRINEMVGKVFNLIMKREPNYMRFYYENLSETKDLMEDFGAGVRFDLSVEEERATRKAYAQMGSKFLRVENTPQARLAIQQGIHATWERAVSEAEHFYHLAEPVKVMQALFGKGTKMGEDGLLSKSLRENYGIPVSESLRSYANSVANPGFYKSHKAFDKMVRIFRGNMVLSALAYNLTTMSKQLPSLIHYIPETGLTRLLSACADVAEDWTSAKDFMEKMAPQMAERNRAIELSLEELKVEIEGKTIGRVRQMGKYGMLGIGIFDRVAVTIGWTATYNKYRDLGWTEAEASLKATRVTMNTQPAASSKELPMLYREGGELRRTALVFMNQLNNILNMATMDTYNYMAQGKVGKAAGNILALAFSGMIIHSLARKEVPDSIEDLGAGFAYQMINSLPFIGKALTGVWGGYRGNSDPFSQIGYLIGKGVLGKEDAEQAVFQLASILLGFPYSGSKRILNALLEEDPSLLLGGVRPKKGSYKITY